ncbi:MAG: hypothetical protein A2283_11965 [Lentisphaerae bacterium RIFOXYA12_FULL_48_11]|nr:MAG: hypothetical protein A2283_11965 [Lentisphaerae bacterium RIFOXYA12_FULL_48_11]
MVHDSTIANALKVRGARTEVLLCDGVLPACEACMYYSIDEEVMIFDGPQPCLCKGCFWHGQKRMIRAGLVVHRYGDFFHPLWRKEARRIVEPLRTENELRAFVFEDLAVGEEAYAGVLRYYAVGDLSGQGNSMALLRRYLESAILTVWLVKKAFESLKPDVMMSHHGIYVPQGVIGKLARKMGIRVVNWAVGYRKKTFIYSHGDTYHRTMINEPVNLWRDRQLSDHERNTIVDYLERRKNGSSDWVKVCQEPEESKEIIRQTLGLDKRPVVLLLTNVTWDAQLYYKNNGFPSLVDWLKYSIRYFENRPDCQLVVRVHPAEVRGAMPSRQPVLNELKKYFSAFPVNVKVVSPNSNMSTYVLADMADCVIIFGTKTGVELAAKGIPVIVAGEAWIREKGLTIDVKTEGEYKDVLDKLPLRKTMSGMQTDLALRYAYHYFFRRLIPVSVFKDLSDVESPLKRISLRAKRAIVRRRVPGFLPACFSFDSRKIDALQEGKDLGLDVICRGILSGSEFVYDEEGEHAV